MASSSSPDARSPLPPNTPSTVLMPALSTPTLGPQGSFTVACSTHIAASPAVCAATILDHGAYPSWNRFCRSVAIDAQPASPPDPSDPRFAAADHHDAEPASLPAFVRGGPAFLALGTQFTFDVHMDALAEDSSGRATALEVSLLERIRDDEDEAEEDDNEPRHRRRGWRVAWKARGMPGFVLRSERVQELLETPDGGTEYYCWETFYGLLAPVVRYMVGGQLVTGFGAWMEDLKGEAEKRTKDQKTAA